MHSTSSARRTGFTGYPPSCSGTPEPEGCTAKAVWRAPELAAPVAGGAESCGEQNAPPGRRSAGRERPSPADASAACMPFALRHRSGTTASSSAYSRPQHGRMQRRWRTSIRARNAARIGRRSPVWASRDWIRRQQNLIIHGATGVGKTWIACAPAGQACRLDIPVLFYRASELCSTIRDRAHEGALPKLKLALAKPSLLLLDDLGLGEIDTLAGSSFWNWWTGASAPGLCSSRASTRLRSSRASSRTRPLPTRCSTASCTRRTGSVSRASRCAR